MSNKLQIETSLKSLILEDGREFVAMLSGEWGIGKTYFWQEFTKNHLQAKDVVYISLFGKNSLADIETEIVTKLYKYNKGLKKYTKHLDTVGNMASKAMGLPINVSIGSLLSLFKASDFKNTIICFDDFERLSDKVYLKDVLGLISQFKEQKECKIIMILNERELDKLSDIDGKKHDEIFALYKEKVVDYNFHYNPSQKELFEAIKEDIEKLTFCEHQPIYDFFQKIYLKNIRIMKQSLYLLNHFAFIKDYALDEKVINEFVEIALNLFVFKAKSNYNYSEFEDLKGYTPPDIARKAAKALGSSPDEDFEETRNDKYEKHLIYYYSLPYFLRKDELEELIYLFIDNHNIDKTKIQDILRFNNDNLNKSNIRDAIFMHYNKARFDFSSNLNQCAKDIFNLLENNKTDIPYIFQPIDLEPYLHFIAEHANSIMFQKFRDELIKLYIDFQPDGMRHRFSLIDYKNFIDKFYSHLMPYLQDALDKEARQQININDIQTRLEKFSSHSSNNNQDIKFLNSLSSGIYKQHILESSEFYNEVTAFLSARPSTELKETTENLKKSLLELSKENKDNEWRINQFLNNTDIKLGENK